MVLRPTAYARTYDTPRLLKSEQIEGRRFMAKIPLLCGGEDRKTVQLSDYDPKAGRKRVELLGFALARRFGFPVLVAQHCFAR